MNPLRILRGDACAHRRRRADGLHPGAELRGAGQHGAARVCTHANPASPSQPVAAAFNADWWTLFDDPC